MAAAKNGAPSTHERRLMESESRWLQKALFALSKAEDDRGKLADARDGDEESVIVEIDGKEFDMSAVHEAMSEAIQQRAEKLRESLTRGQMVAR